MLAEQVSDIRRCLVTITGDEFLFFSHKCLDSFSMFYIYFKTDSYSILKVGYNNIQMYEEFLIHSNKIPPLFPFHFQRPFQPFSRPFSLPFSDPSLTVFPTPPRSFFTFPACTVMPDLIGHLFPRFLLPVRV